MAMADGLEVALQKAIVARLRADANVTALVDPDNIFDRSQRPERDLCIVTGEDQWIDEPHTLKDDLLRAYLTLHIWHLSQDTTTVKNIVSAIRHMVRATPMEIAEAKIIRLKFQNAKYFRDPGGNYIHAVVTLNALIQLQPPESDFDYEFSGEFLH